MNKGTLKEFAGQDNPSSFVNVLKIARLTQIDKDKIYANLKQKYSSFTPEERKQVATVLMRPLDHVFKILGFKISFRPLKIDEPANQKTAQR